MNRVRAVLAYVDRYQAQHRCAPVLEEIALELGVSVPRVHVLVARLEAEGRLESLWVSGRRSPRSLRVVEDRQLVMALVVGSGAGQ
jgi:DNA-binding MarR family transcriptional regulator